MIEVLGGYVLLQPIDTESTGIFTVTETNNEKILKCKVIGVGKSIINEWGTRLETDVKEGDVVFIRSYGHDDLVFEGKNYKLCRFVDITLRIHEDK